MRSNLFDSKSVFFAAIALLALGSLVYAAGPGTPAQGLPYQGRLEQNGNPVSALDVPMVFRLYDGDIDDGAAVELWSDSFDVTVTSGTFNVVLGHGGVTLPPSVFAAAELWVGAEVNGVALPGRNQIWALAQVGRAAQADHAATADLATLATTADFATEAASAEAASGGNFEVSNGRIWRGADPGGTSDLGLYSGVNGNFIRIVTNNSQTVFYNDGGRGSSADLTITATTTRVHNALDVDGNANFDNPIRLPAGTAVGTGGDSNPEVYLASTLNTCTRGQVSILRPSAQSGQDSLCYCGNIDGNLRWVCFNP